VSRGLGRTQRKILRYLAQTGSDDVEGVAIDVYPNADDLDLEMLKPTVRRALSGLARAGLATRQGERTTRTGSYKVVWAATDSGRALVAEWDATERG
jgi:hypothetical protein